MVAISEQTLQGITQRLVEELRPERIYLFGSHTYGTPDRNSDLDFVIVLPDAAINKSELDGKARRVIGDVGCDVDVLIYTATRFDRRSGWQANLKHTVRNKGRLLFGVDGMAFAREWLERARNDREAASMMLSGERVLPNVAAFHCQQAVEKTLKAYLVEHNQSFEKQHDCGKLCDLCAEVDPSFRSLRERAAALNGCADNARYPEEPVPPIEEVREAFAFVGEVWSFVLSRLPEELRKIEQTRWGSTTRSRSLDVSASGTQCGAASLLRGGDDGAVRRYSNHNASRSTAASHPEPSARSRASSAEV